MMGIKGVCGRSLLSHLDEYGLVVVFVGHSNKKRLGRSLPRVWPLVNRLDCELILTSRVGSVKLQALIHRDLTSGTVHVEIDIGAEVRVEK